MSKYIDLSHYHTVNNWDKVKENCPFVISKATEGQIFIDSSLDSFINNCEKKKISYWLYTFLRAGNEVAQAEFLVKTCKNKIGDYFIGYILDLEFSASTGKTINVPVTALYPNVKSSGGGLRVWGICSGKKLLAGFNDLAAVSPRLAREWHPTKNGKVTPKEITSSSNKRVWWQCSLGHEWKTSVYSRTGLQTQCPYCTNRKVLKGFNDLATLEPKIASQWHPDLNGSLTPEQVTVGSKKKIWWICPEGHVWKTAVYPRTGSGKTGCPVCAGNVSEKQRRRYKMMELSQKNP